MIIQMWMLSLMIVFVGGGVLWDCRLSRQLYCVPLPRPYRDRPSQLAGRKRNCSDEVIVKADDLLRILREAFSFNPDDRYQCASSDRIMAVQRAC